LRSELQDLEAKLQDPAIYSDKNYPKLAKRKSELETIIALFDEKQKLLTDKQSSEELAKGQDTELKQMALNELEELEPKLEANEQKLIDILTPEDPNNDRDIIIEIRAAAGGDESSLFAGELYRMYMRWAESHNYKTELINETPNEVGGFNEITFAVHGSEAYKNLKFEAGVHRDQPRRPAHRCLPQRWSRWPIC
jgi:peptide chain release factor 1